MRSLSIVDTFQAEARDRLTAVPHDLERLDVTVLVNVVGSIRKAVEWVVVVFSDAVVERMVANELVLFFPPAGWERR